MRMYGYHDNGFITWTTSFCTNLLFQSILVYKNVRIKKNTSSPVKKTYTETHSEPCQISKMEWEITFWEIS